MKIDNAFRHLQSDYGDGLEHLEDLEHAAREKDSLGVSFNALNLADDDSGCLMKEIDITLNNEGILNCAPVWWFILATWQTKVRPSFMPNKLHLLEYETLNYIRKAIERAIDPVLSYTAEWALNQYNHNQSPNKNQEKTPRPLFADAIECVISVSSISLREHDSVWPVVFGSYWYNLRHLETGEGASRNDIECTHAIFSGLLGPREALTTLSLFAARLSAVRSKKNPEFIFSPKFQLLREMLTHWAKPLTGFFGEWHQSAAWGNTEQRACMAHIFMYWHLEPAGHGLTADDASLTEIQSLKSHSDGSYILYESEPEEGGLARTVEKKLKDPSVKNFLLRLKLCLQRWSTLNGDDLASDILNHSGVYNLIATNQTKVSNLCQGGVEAGNLHDAMLKDFTSGHNLIATNQTKVSSVYQGEELGFYVWKDAVAKRQKKNKTVSKPHKHMWQLTSSQTMSTIGKQLEQLNREASVDSKKHAFWLSSITEKNGQLPLTQLPRNTVSLLDGLAEKYPHAEKVISTVLDFLSLAKLSGDNTVKLPPLLLEGSPGIGKTTVCLDMAECLLSEASHAHRVDIGLTSAGWVLTGSSPTWQGAKPGLIAQALLADQAIANPVFVLDEIDKTSSTHQYPIDNALLGLLEAKTAARFQDEFLSIQMNVTPISWLATCNDAKAMNPYLKSRMLWMQMMPPTDIQMQHIMQTIWAEVTAGVRKKDKKLIDVRAPSWLLINKPTDLRKFKVHLNSALGRASRRRTKGKLIVDPADLLAAEKIEPQNRMGF